MLSNRKVSEFFDAVQMYLRRVRSLQDVVREVGSLRSPEVFPGYESGSFHLVSVSKCLAAVSVLLPVSSSPHEAGLGLGIGMAGSSRAVSP